MQSADKELCFKYRGATQSDFFTGALAACHYIPQRREKIFTVLYKALNSNSTELQEVAHNCMKNVRLHVISNQKI